MKPTAAVLARNMGAKAVANWNYTADKTRVKYTARNKRACWLKSETRDSREEALDKMIRRRRISMQDEIGFGG